MDKRDTVGWWRDTRLFAAAFAAAAIGATLFFVTLAVAGDAAWRITALVLLLPAALLAAVFQHAASQDRVDESRQVSRDS
jgi:hypothetical protein